MKKSTHGGRRKNAGRKAQHPALGARVKTSITMRSDHFELLSGKDRSAYIDAGLDVVQYALRPGDPATESCLIAYYAVCDAIQRLERIRDYNPKTGEADGEFYWTMEDAEVHALLMNWWEEIRKQPLYKSAKIPTLSW